MNRKLYNVNIVSTASETNYTLQSRACPAATQWPTQKAMGQGAPRSQMDVRICFRVREHRDVDLILRRACSPQAGRLNAPGKFLIAPVPRPARQAFLSGFEREVDPDEVLPTDERRQRARHALRTYMLRLASARHRPPPSPLAH